MEWPRSVGWMRRLAGRLAGQFPETGRPEGLGPLPLFWRGLLPWNVVFQAVVVVHGLGWLPPH
jgi:hypothetical protein